MLQSEMPLQLEHIVVVESEQKNDSFRLRSPNVNRAAVLVLDHSLFCFGKQGKQRSARDVYTQQTVSEDSLGNDDHTVSVHNTDESTYSADRFGRERKTKTACFPLR